MGSSTSDTTSQVPIPSPSTFRHQQNHSPQSHQKYKSGNTEKITKNNQEHQEQLEQKQCSRHQAKTSTYERTNIKKRSFSSKKITLLKPQRMRAATHRHKKRQQQEKTVDTVAFSNLKTQTHKDKENDEGYLPIQTKKSFDCRKRARKLIPF